MIILSNTLTIKKNKFVKEKKSLWNKNKKEPHNIERDVQSLNLKIMNPL
jgi:uncharacterized protein (DUF2344 family)